MAASRATSGCRGLSSRIRFAVSLISRCRFSKRSRCMSRSPSSATRHTALSVSRSELRTSLTESPRASLKIAMRLWSLAGGAGCRFERLLLMGADRGHPEFVDRVGQQQNLDAAGAKPFKLRALLQQIEIVAGDRIDR